MTDVVSALEDLAAALSQVHFPLPTTTANAARVTVAEDAEQVRNYLLPRYARLDAPLLAVVGGSTGAGKSLLVNSLVGAAVARSSAIRPTTRSPLLVHAPADRPWFDGDRILPDLARVSITSPRSSGAGGQGEDKWSCEPVVPRSELELASSLALPRGLALLDSPDIDSVVTQNRLLAGQLMAAADLWVFVTTAARYSDAIAWKLLAQAARRDIVLAVVLNRVPDDSAEEILPDLTRRLDAEGLSGVPVFVIPENRDDSGFIPETDLGALRHWLTTLAVDAESRAEVARQTLRGATEAILLHRRDLLAAFEDQIQVRVRMEAAVSEAFALAVSSAGSSLRDASVLRGEVIARWQEVVGTGEWMRRLERGVSSVRDRMTGWFQGRPARKEQGEVDSAIEDSLMNALVGAGEEAIAEVESEWSGRPDSAVALPLVTLRSHEDREEDAARQVRVWQRNLVEMVSSTGKDKKARARVLAVGVNLVGTALMVVIFASTAGLTGAEVAVAGGTALAAQRVLEAVFGDEAVRKMTTAAREDLSERAKEFFQPDVNAFEAAIAELGLDQSAGRALAQAFDEVRASTGLRGSETP